VITNPLINEAMFANQSVITRCYYKVRGRFYAVVIWRHWSDKTLVWTAFRPNKQGNGWDKILCFNRTEAKRFPKMIAKAAADLLNQQVRAESEG